jgi:hypothetical protein
LSASKATIHLVTERRPAVRELFFRERSRATLSSAERAASILSPSLVKNALLLYEQSEQYSFYGLTNHGLRLSELRKPFYPPERSEKLFFASKRVQTCFHSELSERFILCPRRMLSSMRGKRLLRLLQSQRASVLPRLSNDIVHLCVQGEYHVLCKRIKQYHPHNIPRPRDQRISFVLLESQRVPCSLRGQRGNSLHERIKPGETIHVN